MNGTDMVLDGVTVVTAPLWVPFWLIGWAARWVRGYWSAWRRRRAVERI